MTQIWTQEPDFSRTYMRFSLEVRSLQYYGTIVFTQNKVEANDLRFPEKVKKLIEKVKKSIEQVKNTNEKVKKNFEKVKKHIKNAKKTMKK